MPNGQNLVQKLRKRTTMSTKNTIMTTLRTTSIMGKEMMMTFREEEEMKVAVSGMLSLSLLDA